MLLIIEYRSYPGALCQVHIEIEACRYLEIFSRIWNLNSRCSVLRTALLLPSILFKLDELLVVKEMNNRFFDNKIREDLLSDALTPVSAGRESDYERLELLGMYHP